MSRNQKPGAGNQFCTDVSLDTRKYSTYAW